MGERNRGGRNNAPSTSPWTRTLRCRRTEGAKKKTERKISKPRCPLSASAGCAQRRNPWNTALEEVSSHKVRGGDDGGTTEPKERRTVHDLIQRERLAGPVGPDDRGREDRRVRGEGPEPLEGLRVHGEFAGGGVRGGHQLEGVCIRGGGVCEGEEEDGGEGEKLASPFVSFHGVESWFFENRAAMFAGLTTSRGLAGGYRL